MTSNITHPENLPELVSAAKAALKNIKMFHSIEVEIFIPKEEITIAFSQSYNKEEIIPLKANQAMIDIYQFQKALENSLGNLGYKDPVIKVVPTMILPTPNNIQTFDIVVGGQWNKKL